MDNDDLEFELEVTGHDGAYRVEARSTLGGESGADMRFPLEEFGIEQEMERLRSALLYSAVRTRRIPTRDEKPVQRLGSAMFDHLLTGDVRLLFDMTRQQAAVQDAQLRIVLRMRPPELAVLPWEFLYDARRDDYLSLSMPLVRYPEILEPVRPLHVAGPLRILGMVAQPSGYEALSIDVEKAHLERSLGPLVKAGRVHLEWTSGETWRDLFRALDASAWHVVHFIGHGGFDEASGEGIFHLQGESGGNYQLRASHLAQLLSSHHSLRLVMLNSCESAAGNANDLFSSAAATLVRRGIPAVLAMQFEISDLAAVEFTRSFYEAVAVGDAVDSAVRKARLSVCLSRPNSLEWGTPVLFLRQRDGRIFDVRPRTDDEVRPQPVPPVPVGPVPPVPVGPARPAPAPRPVTVRPRATGPVTVRPLADKRDATADAARRVPGPARVAAPPRAARSPSRPPPVRPSVRHRRLLIGTAAGVVVACLVGTFSWLSSGPEAGWTTLDLPADSDWTATAVTVTKGERLTFDVDGEVYLAQGVPTGPVGISTDPGGSTPVLDGANLGTVIARIDGGRPFAVVPGESATADTDGRLSLCVNDGDRTDDVGHYTVHVRVDR